MSRAMKTPTMLLVLIVLVGTTTSTHRAPAAAGVDGSFRLARASFAVGEPIVVEFNVKNGSDAPFTFFEGGDYRGTLAHARYEFAVADEAGL